MGLFNKKKEKNSGRVVNSIPLIPDIPPLPELPELPRLPELGEDEFHPLPKLPDNSFGRKFSQNVIKDAVTGEKEGEPFANEVADNEMQVMQRPQIFRSEKMTKSEEKNEPIFVRLDRFEDGLRALETAKKQISEIEKTLEEIKRLKDEEEKELSNWEKQISLAKEHAEKIDKDIFSKIE